jgi:hypothetical protein
MLVALKCQEDSGKAIGSGKVGNESDLRHSALDPELLELALPGRSDRRQQRELSTMSGPRLRYQASCVDAPVDARGFLNVEDM